jgi:hypothetical protein
MSPLYRVCRHRRGVLLLSPFFGQATSAGPARRIELGISPNF